MSRPDRFVYVKGSCLVSAASLLLVPVVVGLVLAGITVPFTGPGSGSERLGTAFGALVVGAGLGVVTLYLLSWRQGVTLDRGRGIVETWTGLSLFRRSRPLDDFSGVTVEEQVLDLVVPEHSSQRVQRFAVVLQGAERLEIRHAPDREEADLLAERVARFLGFEPATPA